jgi:hypothetical protein
MDNIEAAHIHIGNFSENGDVVATLFNSSKKPTDVYCRLIYKINMT